MTLSRNLQRLLATTAFVAAASTASAQILTSNTTQILTNDYNPLSIGGTGTGNQIISNTNAPAIVISGTTANHGTINSISSSAIISATGAGGTISLSTWNGLLNGVTINNSGTIINNTANGTAINLAGGASAVSSTIRNDGTISGSIAMGANQITYSSTGGTLNGGITTTNNGTGASADAVTLTNGVITGNVNLGAGTNNLTVSGTSARLNGNFTGGANVDTVLVTNGTVSGSLTLAGGNDVVTVTNGTVTAGAAGNTAIDTGANDDTVTLVNSTVTGAMAFGAGTDNLYISGTNAFTTGGAITGLENLGISNTVNLNHALGTSADLATVGIAAGARLNMAESVSMTGALINAGTIDIAAGKYLQFDSASSNITNGRFIVGLTSTSLGTISITTGGLGTLSNPSITINMGTNAGFIASGTTRLLVDAAGATSITTAITNSQTGVYRFSLLAANANDINLVIGRVSTSSVVEGATNKAVANVLDVLGNTTNAQLQSVQSAIGAAANANAVNDVLDSLLPSADGGLGNAAVGVGVSAGNQVSNRLASLRNGTALSGINTGDGMYGRNVWVEGFGGITQQDDKDGAKGYDANTYGMSFGMDTDALVNDATVGAAFTYSQGSVESNAASNAETDINSYIGTVYGSRGFDNGVFVNAQASMGLGQYESERTVIGVGKAKGEFDGLQASLKGEVGKDYAMEALTLTPMAGLQYSYLNLDEYTETGAGGASLRVNPEDMSTLDASAGLKATYTVPMANGGTLKPSVHAKYVYRMGDETLQTTSQFTGGGAAFETNGIESDSSRVNLGAGLLLTSAAGMDLSAEYNADLSDSMTGHTGQLKARWAF